MIFRNVPIRQKLIRIIMLTCSVALIMMASASILFQYFSFKKAEEQKVLTRAIILASNSTAALAFDSPKDATEILKALRADKYIITACLYDINGHIFATYPAYVKPSTLPVHVGTAGFHSQGNYIEGFQPVMQAKLPLGTLYIKSSIRGVYAAIYLDILIAAVLIALTLIVAYLLSSWLQKAISEPIISLEKTAKTISEHGNYGFRAVKFANDELGALTDAFNQMLIQIEAQNLEILKVSEESSKLAAIVESSGDVIIGNSIDLIITSWNNSAERVLGYTAAEMLGQPVFKIIASPELGRTDILTKLKLGHQVQAFDTQFISKNGSLLDISLTISPVKDTEGNVTGISQIARDITAQRKNERKIIENEEHLRLATQAAQLGTFNVDLIAGTINTDSRCRELFGTANYEPKHYKDGFLNKLHPDDRLKVAQIIEASFNKKKSNGDYDAEYRTINTDDKLRWIKARGKVFFDEWDSPVRFIGSVLDITGEKQEEQKKNDFIAIISHELKTPITVIKSYLQILLSKAKKEENNPNIIALTRAEAQTNKMSSMIKDFLNLARIEAGKIMLVREEFDLSDLLKDIAAEAHLLSNSHNINLDCLDTIIVHADKDKIGQVLINLINNSVKYSPIGSKITVGCAEDQGRIKIFVCDEGHGISASDQKELFTRFYRVDNEKTKTISGFGIGLYIVSEILKHHNSEINLESQVGLGSTFYFYLDSVASLQPAEPR